MDNALLIGLNAQQLLRQRLEIHANNIANVTTNGFKAEQVLSREVVERPAKANQAPKEILFSEAYALQRDTRTGPMQYTGNDLDLALEDANSFFTLQGPEGKLYTRDGQFSLDDLSRLVNRDGLLVLDNAEREITFDPVGPTSIITENGLIRQGDIEIGRLAIARFETPGALEKQGDNLLRATDEEPDISRIPGVRQGFMEGSNVRAILELTQIMQVSKAYEMASRIVKESNDLREKTIKQIGQG